ncbi:polysaccharide deacetylase family sporulation protein PdaB [Halobacillus dabanensis]|uniref:Polysaccharide deacetylase family sporulation protein PdaB n=1 Tax=Halobacillus dabanensis TaxID=240302 RepID=A0A1I3PTV5_HALDA|nr:polysaccharide deacetylase family protein [Halobacillus dabanensis]SFJ24899.1 polysaccharide deacetylase family sporulation protein PdaB [Halobacillus dabanensis]
MKNLKLYVALLMVCVLLLPVSVYGKNHPRHYYEEQGTAIWDVPISSKYIAITFDDGPSPKYTPEILDILEEYDARATFFVVGSRAQENPSIIKSMVEDGHELANHSYHHPDFTGISKQDLISEMDNTAAVLENLTGVPPKLFRPPGGVYNDIIVNTANEEGYMVVMWSWHQDTRDWKSPGVHKIVSTVLNNTRNGDIVLFHDYGGDRSQTVKALKQILPQLKEEGYEFVTVSELMQKHSKYNLLHGVNGVK